MCCSWHELSLGGCWWAAARRSAAAAPAATACAAWRGCLPAASRSCAPPVCQWGFILKAAVADAVLPWPAAPTAMGIAIATGLLCRQAQKVPCFRIRSVAMAAGGAAATASGAATAIPAAAPATGPPAAILRLMLGGAAALVGAPVAFRAAAGGTRLSDRTEARLQAAVYGAAGFVFALGLSVSGGTQ